MSGPIRCNQIRYHSDGALQVTVRRPQRTTHSFRGSAMPQNQNCSTRRRVRDNIPPNQGRSGTVHLGKQLEQDAGWNTRLQRARQPRRGGDRFLPRGGPTRRRRAFVGAAPRTTEGCSMDDSRGHYPPPTGELHPVAGVAIAAPPCRTAHGPECVAYRVRRGVGAAPV